MLVGRRVEDDLRLILLEDLLHPGLVGDVRDDGGGVDFGPFLLDFQPDIVQRGFRRVNQDELVGIEHRHLPHDFTADGTGRAGDEHPLPFQVRGDFLHVDLDGVAAQEIFDLDLLDGALRQGSRPGIVRHFRRQEDLDAHLQETVRQVGALQHLGLGRRNDHRPHLVPVQLRREVIVVANDLHAHHHLTDHIRVVGHEAHESEAVILLRAEGLGDIDTGHGAVDIGIQLLPGARVQIEMVIQHLDEHPGRRQKQERHEIGDHQHGDAGQMHPQYGRAQRGDDQRATVGQCQRDEQVHHIDERRQAENIRIGPEDPEKQDGERQHDHERPRHLPLHQFDIRKKKTGQIRYKYRKYND